MITSGRWLLVGEGLRAWPALYGHHEGYLVRVRGGVGVMVGVRVKVRVRFLVLEFKLGLGWASRVPPPRGRRERVEG